MEFEWDAAKRLAGIAKHRVDLLYAAALFAWVTAVAEDTRAEYGVAGQIAVGQVDGEVFVVAFTERDGRIRLISARKGGRRDGRKYEARLAGGDSGLESQG